MTDTEFKEHQNDPHKPFECDHCVSVKIAKEYNSVFVQLPYPVECDDFIFGKPEEKARPDVSSISPEQLKKFVKQCDAIRDHLDEANENNEELITTSVNSNYYDIKKFNKIKHDKESSFGLLHVNIASLNLHVDDLRTVLSRMKPNIDIIGITEHKIRKDKDDEVIPPSNNIDIGGYEQFKFEPTGTTHGGAGLYIKNGIDYIVRKELNLNSPSQHEAMFVEIVLKNRKNLVIGCIYRHPSSDISITDFAEKYIEPILHKINKERKEFVLMGDFNIDLLKASGDNAANKFYNSLTSYFFTPYILQPSRLRSQTLIDNIFFNSLESHSYSGNLLHELSDHLTSF